MAETAPVPEIAETLARATVFDAKPTPTTPDPLENWGQPAGEDRIHRALPDSGYLDASPRALENLRRCAERDRAWGHTASGDPVILHQVDLDRQRRERESAAEAARKAGPEPRKVLAAAHELAAEAQTEVARLKEPLDRTRQLVADLDDRVREHEEAALAARKEEAAELIAALGRDEPPPEIGESVSRAAVFALDAELDRARAALQQLEATMVKAVDLLERRRHGVSRCALNVMVDRAAGLGDAIIEADEALAGRRADLAALARLLTSETRRLNRVPPPMPASISRALSPVDPILHGTDRTHAATDWSTIYAALCEAPTGPLSDTAEDDPPLSSA